MTRSQAEKVCRMSSGIAIDDGFLLEGNPDVGRIAAQRLAEESGWRDADNGEGMTLDIQRGAEHGGVAAVGGLPGAMTEDGHRGRGGRVVIGGEDAAGEGTYPQGGEIVSGDVFGAQRAGGRFDAFATDRGAPVAGLEGGKLFEFRGLGLQALEQVVGEHAPSVLRTAFDAAVVAFADAVEAGGVGDREGAEHYGVDEGEDGGGAADAEGEGENGGGGEDGG